MQAPLLLTGNNQSTGDNKNTPATELLMASDAADETTQELYLYIYICIYVMRHNSTAVKPLQMGGE